MHRFSNRAWLAISIALGALVALGLGLDLEPSVGAAQEPQVGAGPVGTWVVLDSAPANGAREVVRYNTASGVMQLRNLTTMTCGQYLRP